jgi:hypothetical protein
MLNIETPNVGIASPMSSTRPQAAIEIDHCSGTKVSTGQSMHSRAQRFFRSNEGMLTITYRPFRNQLATTHRPIFRHSKHFEIAARAAGIIIDNAPDQYEYALALNYFIKGHSIKLQTDYALIMNNRGQDLNDQRVRTQMQIVF